ncbi:unnamed protein product (mitochondrion) [Plasmodiophora brassicae]|uniref:Uncharacterized protein n=1 Tax=Plasmodiophora brassicae TaxID=37360 RepID=A0A3P3YNN0_PLABS|nr:unnamed protein product [Plasmodiophora brassicae]
MHSWIASVNPHSSDDLFDVGQAMYRLVKSAQWDVIAAAALEKPFSDFIDIRDDFWPTSDPTDVPRIERVIEAVRLVQLGEALCDDLYLRFEALASFVTVFHSLLPLIRTNLRYANIGTTTNPVQETTVEYLSKFMDMQRAVNQVYEERNLGDALHRIQIGITKSAITKVFNVSLTDLTTPLFPRSEPRPRIVQKKKKNKSKRNRRNRKRKQDMYDQNDVDIDQDELETKPSSPIAQQGDVEIRIEPSTPPPASTIATIAVASSAERQCSTTVKSTKDNPGTNPASTRPRPAGPVIHHDLPESEKDPLLALKSKIANIPSRMSDFVKEMSSIFNVKQSKTRNSLAFFDKRTGIPVFGMHRPHAKFVCISKRHELLRHELSPKAGTCGSQ